MRKDIEVYENEEESKDGPEARGKTEVDDMVHQNFKLLFGCKPNSGIGARSKMSEDFCRALKQSYDANMVCMLTDALDAMMASDVNFEVISSQTAKPLMMFYAHNIVRKLRAYIFVQSLLKGFLDWNGTVHGYHFDDDEDRLSAKELSESIQKQL